MDNRNNQVLFSPTQKAVPAVADLSSFYQAYGEIVKVLGADSSFHYLISSEVPSGIVRIVSVLTGIDFDSAIDQIYLEIAISGNNIKVTNKLNLAKDEYVSFFGPVVLDENDSVRAKFEGCSIGDLLHLHVIGYDIKKY